MDQNERQALEEALKKSSILAGNMEAFWDEEKQDYLVPEFSHFKTIWELAKAHAVPQGHAVVPQAEVREHYVAQHLKGTTCSVDVSELTGNFGDRIYGKLRPYDCLGSDGNTLLYDLESANFKLLREGGNQGDFVLVSKEPADA